MNGYIYSIVCIAAAGGIACILSPSSGIKKHLRLVCALCLLCVMISPVLNFLNSIRDFFDGEGSEIFETDDTGELRDKYESIYNKYLEGGYSDNVGEAVKDILYENLGVSKENCRVSVQFADKNGDGVREPTKITVILSGKEVLRDPSTVKELVRRVFEFDCVCAID